jgi:hypothetical protein
LFQVVICLRRKLAVLVERAVAEEDVQNVVALDVALDAAEKQNVVGKQNVPSVLSVLDATAKRSTKRI